MVSFTDRKLLAKGFLYDLIPQCFLPTGNCSRRVSHSAWLHGVSYTQETVRERFPIRLDSTVFLTDRKLFAKGFLSALTPWCFLPTGNCSHIVSYSAWLHGVSYPRETVRERFPIRLDSTVFLTDRKLFAYSFLFGLAPWCCLPTGNCSPGDFSTPLEMTKGHGSMVFLAHRKLFAKGFLFGLAPWCFLPAGNCSRRVSHSAWLHGVLYRQETVGERFPVRLDSTVFLTDRKLVAYSFLFDVAPLRFISIGNYSHMVSYPA